MAEDRGATSHLTQPIWSNSMSEVTPAAATVAEPEPTVEPAAVAEPIEGEAELREAGKQALDRMKADRTAARAEARAARAEADELRAQIANKDKPAEEVALENARKEGESAANKAANLRVLRSELKAIATGKLADPTDAHLYIDLATFDVNDDGEPDSDALAEAIDKLLVSKPHLAAVTAPAPRFQGGADGGAAAPAKPDESIDDAISAAQQARNFPLVATLKQQKAAQKG